MEKRTLKKFLLVVFTCTDLYWVVLAWVRFGLVWGVFPGFFGRAASPAREQKRPGRS
jgi:hypothetical protein